MNFSFVIITTEGQENNLNQVCNSIVSYGGPTSEIIIVGGSKREGPETIWIPFDESIKPAWITRKKNLGWQAAKYENIVFLHDYVKLNAEWYEGFLEFGNDWHGCVNKLIHLDGVRGVDWVLPPYNLIPAFRNKMEQYGAIPIHNQEVILPYHLSNFGKYVYMPGNYFLAKKALMEEFPLDESRVWGQEEDVEWSQRVQTKYGFSLNVFSSCSYIKPKPVGHYHMTPNLVKKLMNIPL
jgi:hypothetical protein